MNENGCKMTGCVKKIFFPAVAVFIFLFFAEYLIHHVWLMPLYEDTAALWRDESEMQALFPGYILRLAMLSLLFTVLYCKCKPAQQDVSHSATGMVTPCQWKRGICFGSIIGLLLGTMMASSYLWMPIPFELAVNWFISGVLEGIGVGLVLSFPHRKKGADAA